ncbi:MAG: D-alanyl-D-alanine carboxypeptidase family protein [Clostridium sp.]
MTKTNILKKFALALTFALLAPIASSAIIANAAPNNPTIQAQSAIVMDYETGEVIYSKAANEKRYPASTTKLMTALLLAENKTKSDDLIFTQTAKDQPPYSINTNYRAIAVGSKINADTVMQALLLYSGNDMAYVIADNIGGDSKSFADLMNKRAKELGMNNTNFVTPNGLDEGIDNHQTTAYDMALLTKAAYENQWVRETLMLKDTHVDLPDGTRLKLDNRNKGLGSEGNIGGKTGYTSKAVGCFAGVYERNGRKLVGVVLKTSRINDIDMTMFEDTNTIMDYSYTAEKTPFKKSGEQIEEVELSYKLFKFFGPTKTIKVPVTLAEDATYYDNDLYNKEAKLSFTSSDRDAWSIAFNSDINVNFTALGYNQQLAGKIDLSFFDLIKANIGFYLISLLVITLIVILIIFAVKIIGNGGSSTKRRRRY